MKSFRRNFQGEMTIGTCRRKTENIPCLESFGSSWANQKKNFRRFLTCTIICLVRKIPEHLAVQLHFNKRSHFNFSGFSMSSLNTNRILSLNDPVIDSILSETIRGIKISKKFHIPAFTPAS